MTTETTTDTITVRFIPSRGGPIYYSGDVPAFRPHLNVLDIVGEAIEQNGENIQGQLFDVGEVAGKILVTGVGEYEADLECCLHFADGMKDFPLGKALSDIPATDVVGVDFIEKDGGF